MSTNTLEPRIVAYVQRLDDALPPNPIPDWVKHYADLNAYLVKRRADLDRAEAMVRDVERAALVPYE